MSDKEMEAWWALEAAADAARRTATAALREQGLTPSQYELLELLEGMRCGCCGEGECRCESSYLCQNDLGGRIACTKGNVSGLVHRLAAEGLISREPDPRDRRYNAVRITGKGRGVLMAARPAFAEAVRHTLAPLNAEDLEALTGALGKLRPAGAQGPALPSPNGEDHANERTR